jgi:uncharacterized protein (TIGR02246 family)
MALVAAAALCGYLFGARRDTRESLFEADRAFDRATAERGVDGWVSFFAADARMVQSNGQVTQGHSAIRELMCPFFAGKTNSLRWNPDLADVARSGDLGYTSGVSKLKTRNAQGQEMERDGRYVTIWRRQQDGQWRAVLDIGSGGPLHPVAKP